MKFDYAGKISIAKYPLVQSISVWNQDLSWFHAWSLGFINAGHENEDEEQEGRYMYIAYHDSCGILITFESSAACLARASATIMIM